MKPLSSIKERSAMFESTSSLETGKPKRFRGRRRKKLHRSKTTQPTTHSANFITNMAAEEVEECKSDCSFTSIPSRKDLFDLASLSEVGGFFTSPSVCSSSSFSSRKSISSFSSLSTEDEDTSSSTYSATLTRQTTYTEIELGGKKLRAKKKRRRGSKFLKIDCSLNPEHWQLIGSGECGVPECQEVLPEGSDRVLYGLVQLKIGSGTFQRTKNIFIHFNGINTPGMVKAYAAEKHNEIHQAFGQIHASICIEDKAEFTIDNIFRMVSGIFSSDDITVNSKFATTLTIEEMREQYKREMEEKRSEFLARQLAEAQAGAPTPVMEEIKVVPQKKDRIQEILDIVRADTGWINWVLFRPTNKKLRLYSTDSFGDGSIFALAEALPEDHCVYGLLRMSFGVRPYRRTHIVQFQWVGPETKRIKRGKDMAKADNMARLLAPYGITLQFGDKADVTVDNVIMRVRNLVTIDGDVEDDEELVRLRLVQEYQDALEEEVQINAEVDHQLEADKESEEQEIKNETHTKPAAVLKEEEKANSIKKITILETINLIQNEKKDLNWCLLEPKRAKKRRPRLGRSQTSVLKKRSPNAHQRSLSVFPRSLRSVRR